MSKKLYVTIVDPIGNELNPWDDLRPNEELKNSICMVHNRSFYDRFSPGWERLHSFGDNMLNDFHYWFNQEIEDRDCTFKEFMANWGWVNLNSEELVAWENVLEKIEEEGYEIDDEETMELLLPLVEGGEWERYISTGYCQGDQRIWYYRSDKFTKKELDIYSDYYWGGYDELHIEVVDDGSPLASSPDDFGDAIDDYWDTISISEDLRIKLKDLMEDHDITEENVRVFKQDGYVQVPQFEVYEI